MSKSITWLLLALLSAGVVFGAPQVHAQDIDPAQIAAECGASGQAPYTEREHAIYQALMDMPMSVSEADAKARVAREFSITGRQVDEIVNRVMRQIYSSSPGTQNTEEVVRCIVGRFADVRNVITSGDFVNVGFIARGATVTTAQLIRLVVDQMQVLLPPLFEIGTVQRIRLMGYYPAIDRNGRPAGEKRVAMVEVQRNEFSASRRPETYPGFQSLVPPGS